MKRVLLVVLLIASFASRYSAAPVFADCLGPNPTATPQTTYDDLVLGTSSGNLIAYWKLDESSGTTAADASGHGNNGTYSGPTLAGATFVDGSNAPIFDGVNDFVNVYSTSLNSAFNHDELTMLAWFKVSSSADWTDGINHAVFRLGASSTNLARLAKSASSQFEGRYVAGGTTKNRTFTLSATTWQQVAITVSKSADEVKVYLNGSQQTPTLTALGTWSGALDSTMTVIGANITTPTLLWDGSIAKVAVWTTALSGGTISTLASVPSISPTATLYPTCTPSPSPSPTITPSQSPTLTLTPSPTFTPSNTADVFIYWTLPAPESTGTAVPGQIVRFDYTISAGQSAVGISLAILFFSLWVIFLIWRFTRR